jgi:hypothetical protein
VLKKGYPKRGDTARMLRRPWAGFTLKTITHPHFGTEPVQVFAIKVIDRENGGGKWYNVHLP